MTTLRPYQIKAKADTYAAWERPKVRNTCLVMPTGAGKTRTLANMVAELQCATCVIAHRQELVGQLSCALAGERIRHGIIAPPSVIKDIVKMQIEEVGASYYDPNARTRVAGVDTLIRLPEHDPWYKQVGLWVQDECHHVQEGNKWGTAAARFPNALGLGVTATPVRTDRKGLGRGHGGIMDSMVIGPEMRELIELGYLTDYRVAIAESDVDFGSVRKTASGEYSMPEQRAAVHKSARIVGDVVGQYLKHAAGKRGITFTVDVEAAHEQAEAYRKQGVPAAAIDGKTKDTERLRIMRDFKAGRLLQLCNCDILGEGVDVPAVEVVSMARRTASYSLYAQQFGRMLRPFPGKTHGLLIDHAGNFLQDGFGPPDRPRIWTLEGTAVHRKPSDAIPQRACPGCSVPYERFLPACPWCGFAPEPAERRTPQQVEGDLVLLDADVLEAMRREAADVYGAPRLPHGAGPEVIGRLRRVAFERQEAQTALREAMALWGGARTAEGLDLRTAQRRFFHEFGIDVMSAQALNTRDAGQLEQRVRGAW